MRRERLPPGLSFRHPASLLATWFGAGLLPWSPGSWGSLAALPFAWILTQAGGSLALVAAAGLVFLVGVWAASVITKHGGESDPQAVVVDEVCGQWLTLAVAPTDVRAYAAGFVLFRLADIVKPWPARWVDRRLPGGPGVMLDDVLAAIYAGAILFILTRTVA